MSGGRRGKSCTGWGYLTAGRSIRYLIQQRTKSKKSCSHKKAAHFWAAFSISFRISHVIQFVRSLPSASASFLACSINADDMRIFKRASFMAFLLSPRISRRGRHVIWCQYIAGCPRFASPANIRMGSKIIASIQIMQSPPIHFAYA